METNQNQPIKNFYDDKTWRLVTSIIWLVFIGISAFSIHLITQIITRGMALSSMAVSEIIFFSIICIPMIILIRSGHIDLSFASIISLSGAIFAFIVRDTNMVFIALLLVVFISMFIGVINGVLAGIAKINTAIITMIISILLTGFTYIILEYKTIILEADRSHLDILVIAGLLLLLVFTAGVVLLVLLTPFEKKISEKQKSLIKRMLFIGIPFVLVGIISGIYGITYTYVLGAAVASFNSLWILASVLVAVIVGGTFPGSRFNGIIPGIIGAILMNLLIKSLNILMVFLGIQVALNHIVTGFLFLFFIVFLRIYYLIVNLIYRTKKNNMGE